MSFYKNLLRIAVLSFYASQSLAGDNPVDCSLTPASGLPATTYVGEHYALTFTCTNAIPFPVNLSIITEGLGNGFSIQDGCSGEALAAKGQNGSSCEVDISFAPSTPEEVRGGIILSYHNNRVPFKSIATTVKNSGEKTGDVVGSTVESLPVPTYVGQGPYGFEFNFKNVGNTDAVGDGSVSSVANGVVVTTNNCAPNVTLSPNQSCIIRGTFSPSVVGIVSIEGSFAYDGAQKTATTKTQTITRQSSGPCDLLSSQVTLPLPTNTLPYSDNIIQFKFENECTTPLELDTVSFIATAPGTVAQTAGDDTCSNQTLAPSASCTVTRSIVPTSQSTGALTVTAQVQVTGGTNHQVQTQSTVVANNYGTHRVTFVNQCPFDVWYGVANDNNTDKADPTNPATPDDYKLPAQLPGQAPSAKSLDFNNKYIGIFFPRVGCTVVNGQLQCTSGNCNTLPQPNGGKCDANEPVPPYTKLEVNLFATGQGNPAVFDGIYDVSVIDGLTVPVEVKGLGPADGAFQCTGMGAPIQPASNELGACNWSYQPPSNSGLNLTPADFTLVTDSGNGSSCGTIPGQCSASETCGLAFKSADPDKGKIVRRCGQVLGYWSASKLCTQNNADFSGFPANQNPREKIQCGVTLNSIPTVGTYNAAATVSDLFGCNSAVNLNQSCYNPGSNTTCCGCYNWNQPGLGFTTAQDTNCNDPANNTSQNPDWLTAKLSGALSFTPFDNALWLKRACPTTYVYPFDDHSAGATACYHAVAGEPAVRMNYQYVFCPGGLTGGITL